MLSFPAVVTAILAIALVATAATAIGGRPDRSTARTRASDPEPVTPPPAGGGTPAPTATPPAEGGSPAPTGTPPVAASPTPTQRARPPACRPAGGVFGPEVRRYLRTRSSLVSGALFDARNGETHLFRPGIRFDTGSIVKVQIMGTLLHDLMLDDRPPTTEEEYRLRLMIEISDNDSATELWNEVGGPISVQAFDRLAGMDHTTPNALGYWGDTTTTALDNIRLIRHFAFPNHVLDDAHRAYGLALMRHVVPADSWGVSYGIAPGTDVALKNGWLPIADGDWEINSIGSVRGSGRQYVLAMLSHRNPTMSYGVETLDQVSKMVWNELRCAPQGAPAA
jgi:hypothetical protein